MRYVLLVLAVLLSAPLLAGSAVQTVAASRLVGAAQDVLREHLASGGEVSITTIGTPEEVRVPMGEVSLQVHPISGRWPRPRVGVPVDVLVDGRVVRSATVWFALSVHSKVLTYGDDEPIGVQAQQLRIHAAEVDVATLQETPVDGPSALDGMRLRKPVQEGSAVLLSDFEKIPDVDRQEKVRVLASYGAIRLATRGVANEKGNAGDVVPVLINGADEPVRARVTEKGVVEVVQ
jgi:flagella basal body P-ring formation protein FlgA